MDAFRRTRNGVEAAGDPVEFRIIGSLMNDIVELLGGDERDREDPLAALEAQLAPARPPTNDPAVARLLPDMSEDPQIAEELRGLTESTVRASKVAHLVLVRDQLAGADDCVRIPERDIPSWLAALTDLRLVLATRLDITDEESATRASLRAQAYARGAQGVDDDEVSRELTLLYGMMSWWQDSLLQAVRFSRPAG